ncbi:uncharacterized protein B0I36DRAFT_338985 [Microdochium trichocladiopsis]|uniref:STL11/RBM22-like N-terminal domain-containing protein n=1 Tax=Microdochium trichocladiopsis TaxID=1682393 RepID=A0A9P8XVQ5_9PEZI|nr:uncharacterized protein B0I36DRAFT_338985 [Microdochium trichocladiopsis]KAH7014623.1 hypothetical protein B0I36DRAFT_338985 [Microdochium trichocladiopsis]
MPPQIKQDLNRSGWESTDFPSVCETCLPDNPYVKMLKEDYGAECKICTRPFTIFSWSTDRAHGRKKRTNICFCAVPPPKVGLNAGPGLDASLTYRTYKYARLLVEIHFDFRRGRSGVVVMVFSAS